MLIELDTADDSITRHEEGPMRAQANGLTRTDFEMNMALRL